MRWLMERRPREVDSAYGIKSLYDSQNSTVDIIFIHGLSGDREKTWTATGASAPWPQTLLPSKIPDARILVFGYNGNMPNRGGFHSMNWIKDHASNLLLTIAQYRSKGNTNERPLVFICHSVGGLVCEQALLMSGQSQEGSLQSVLRWTCGVIFLDTPHYGTTLAKWVVPVSSKGFIKRNSQILQALRPGSEILDHIRDSFLRIVMARNRDGHRPLDITCFHAELSPQGADTQVVSRQSAILSGYPGIGIPKNHIDISRCEDENDTLFLHIYRKIRREIESSAVPTYPHQGGGPLKILTEPDSRDGDAIVDIVFIHGLGGDRETTWTDLKSKICWPSALLPKDIPQARVLTFGYDTRLMEVADHANELILCLDLVRQETRSVNRPIIFVTHSMGGLVCKDALLTSKNSWNELQDIAKSTFGVVFLGTPHRGSNLAIWRENLNVLINPIKPASRRIIRLLKPMSEVASRIQSDFESMTKSRIEAGWSELKIICFYEKLRTSIIFGKVVSQYSATLPPNPMFGIDRNHRDIAKFENSDGRGYRRVVEELRKWVDTIKSASGTMTTVNNAMLTISRSSNQSQTRRYDMKILKEPDSEVQDAVVDIIFIHGLGGSPELSWTMNNVCWPSQLLPVDIPQARILAFDYQASTTGVKEEISIYAKELIKSLVRLRQETQSIQRLTIFVAHGFGGLVCQDALLISRNSWNSDARHIVQDTIGIAFLATPHLGTEFAIWAVYVANFLGVATTVNTRILRLMKPNSEVLRRIQSQFWSMVKSRVGSRLPKLEIICFYETIPMQRVGLIVPPYSATVSGYPAIALHKDHVQMGKFGSREDPDYKNVVGQLRMRIHRITYEIETS